MHDTADHSPRVDVALLGLFSASAAGTTIIDASWPYGRARALIRLLALQPQRAMHREQALQALWPQLEPGAAANNLRQNLHHLRSAFAAHGIGPPVVTNGDGILLLAPHVRLDIDAFREASRQAFERRSDAALFKSALALYGGDLSVEDPYDERAASSGHELSELRIRLLIGLARVEMAHGSDVSATGSLQQVLAADGAHEEAHRLLMRIYARSGQRDRALRQYQRCAQTLRAELGVDPSVETAALHQEIVQGRVRVPAGASPRGVAGAFVGRERELAALRDLLEDADAGRGGVAVIGGEPGIGKTSIAEEFAIYAELRGANVVWTRCSEEAGAPPFAPWLDAIRALAGRRGAEERTGTIAGLLAPSVPARRRAEFLVGGGDDKARRDLFDAVARFLHDEARAQALVIVIDDLHGAHDADLMLLQSVARQISDARILLVVCHRDSALRRPLAPTFAELARDPHHRRFALAGLTRADVHALVAEMFGASADATLADALFERTEGNPLFIRETLRLIETEDGATDAAALRVPANVRDAIAVRIGQLSAGCREVLTVGAVAGREFVPAQLPDIEGVPRGAAMAFFGEACDKRIVAQADAGRGSYSFTHALMREALYDALDPAGRALWHLRVGDALESAHRDNPRAVASPLALHFGRAAHGGHAQARERALLYARQAGENAMNATAYETAARRFTNALDIVALCPDPDEVVRCDLLLELCRARFKAGDGAAAGETAERAAALARQLGLGDRLVTLAMWFAGPWVRPQVDTFMTGVLEDALEALGPSDSTLRAWALARLGFELLSGRHLDRARPLILEAVSVARRMGDPGAIAVSIDKLLQITGDSAPSERLTMADEMLAMAQRAAAPELVLVARMARFDLLLQLGEMEAAWAEQAVFTAEAEELRNRPFLWVAATWRVLRALLDGRLDNATALIAAASAAAREADAPDAPSIIGSELLVLRWEQGRLAEMAPIVAQSVTQSPDMPAFRAVLALVYCEQERLDIASLEFERLAADEFAALTAVDGTIPWAVTAVVLAEVCAVLRDCARAGTLYDLLAPRAHVNITTSTGVAYYGAGARSLGRLAAVLGRRADAERHFADAALANERCGAVTWHTRTLVDHAELIIASPRDAADCERAAGMLARAEDQARSYGGEGLLRRIACLRGATTV